MITTYKGSMYRFSGKGSKEGLYQEKKSLSSVLREEFAKWFRAGRAFQAEFLQGLRHYKACPHLSVARVQARRKGIGF